MASVNQTSSSGGYYSQLTMRNKAIGGLASGLDTDALVEALTTATRSKLAKQTQQKTLLSWKVTAYRGVATSLRDFQKKHVSSTGLQSSAFFNVFKGTATSDKITVKPGSGASLGSFSVDQIKQVATAQTFTTAKFTQDLESTEFALGEDFIGKTLQLSLDGNTKTIKLDTLDGITNNAVFEETLQGLIDTAFGRRTPSNSSELTAYDTVKGDGRTSIIKLALNLESSGDYTLKLSANANTVSVANNADGLGLVAGMSNRIKLSYTIGDLFGDRLAGDTFEVSINDVLFTVNKTDSINSFINKVNVSNAGVKINFSSIDETFVFTSKVTGEGDNIRMNDVQGNFLNLLTGARGGNLFNSPAAYTSIGDVAGNLALGITNDPLQEADYQTLKDSTFVIGLGAAGFTFSLDISKYKDDIEGGVISVNKALEKVLNEQVKARFGENSGIAFAIDDLSGAVTFSSTRNDMLVQITEKGGGLAKLGLAESKNKTITLGYEKTATGSTAIGDDVGTLFDAINANEDGYKMTVTINGVTKDITVTLSDTELEKLLPALPDGITDPDDLVGTEKDEYDAKLLKNQQNFLIQKLNAEVRSSDAFGAAGSNIRFEFNEDGKIKVTAANDTVKFSVSESADPGTSGNLFTSLGLGSSGDALVNHAPGQGTKLSEMMNVTNGSVSITLGNDTKTFAVGQNTTVQDFMEMVNAGFGRDIMKFTGGRLVMNGGTQGIAFDDNGTGIMEGLFGMEDYSVPEKPAYQTAMEAGKGKNAEIIMNGKVISSTTNTFTVNGVDFEVNGATEPNANIVINVVSDPDDVVEKLKTFIEEYNTLIDSLDLMLKEKKVSGYEPLTDEQRAELSETEIKNWETEAKKGLLSSDSTIRSIMTQMRTCLYEQVKAAGISLYDIGITTESNSTLNNGRLELSEAGEEKLRKMLDQNPDAVRALFTYDDGLLEDEEGFDISKKGLAHRLDYIITRATSLSSTRQGTLVELAGSDVLTGDNESTLGKKIEQVDDKIAQLKTRLESEYERYWRKFSALEVAISRMNTQMSWLQGFGGGQEQ